MTKEAKTVKLSVGLDIHPDTFTGALVEGSSSTEAKVLKTTDPLPLDQLEEWMAKNVPKTATVLMEACGNSFELHKRLTEQGYNVLVLESQQMGRICYNSNITDRISAIRIAKVYLSGLSESVWVPDDKTRQRREIFNVYQRAVTDCTRHNNRIRMLLNEHTIRLKKGQSLIEQKTRDYIFNAYAWSETQLVILEEHFDDYDRARQKRQRLTRIISKEVLQDPDMLQLTRIFGLRKIIIYGMVAMIGNIHRFKTPKKLSGYFGVRPNSKQSGNGTWRGGVGRKCRRDIRALLVQAAQTVLRCKAKTNPLFHWAWKLNFRKGRNVTIIAVARKITVAAWYLLMGKPFKAKEESATLYRKLHELAKDCGIADIRDQGFKFYSEYIRYVMENMKLYPCRHT